MSSRYATIITDDDGREVVSAIGEFEGAPDARHGHFELVAADVRIGMVRGGPVDAADGFGFAQTGVGAGAAIIVRAALNAPSSAGQAKAGSTTGAKGDAANRPRKPTPGKPGKRTRRKPKRPAKKTAKPAMSAGMMG